MPFTLQQIGDQLSTAIEGADTNLYNAIQAVGDGSTISVPQMVNIQTEMSRYTVVASLCSSCVKETGDTMKGVVQKIS